MTVKTRKVVQDGIASSRIADQYKAIHEAITDGEFDRARELLGRAGKDLQAIVRQKGPGQSTLLHEAVAARDMPLVQQLVEAGAVVDAPSVNCTPANMTVIRGELDILRYLIDHGADLNGVHPGTGASLLISALASDKTDIALYLLELGAACDDVVKSKINYAAIDYAAARGSATMFIQLAERRVLAARNITPLEYAINFDSRVLVEACLAHPEFRLPFVDERQADIIALCEGVEMLQLLLAARSQMLIAAMFDEPVEDMPAAPKKACWPSL